MAYWIVGATVEDQDMSGDFIERGFWFGTRDTAQTTIENIVPGDRIAIKSLLGQGATQVLIKAIGIVTSIRSYNATEFRFLYVDWIDLRKEDRKVAFSGFGGTIHNVDGASEIAGQVFRL